MSANAQPVAVIARPLDLTERRVRQLSAEGVIPKAARGRYELVGAVQGYVRYLRELIPRDEVGAADYGTERARLVKARAEYQRGIMDAISDPAVETVVVMSSAQVGKTEVLLNAVGYHVDQDPAPVMMVMPTERDAETWSKDCFSTMARDTACLRGRISDPKSRDGSNKILHKKFPGGHLTIVGANAPSGLASRPIRVLLCDEVDRYPPSAGAVGEQPEVERDVADRGIGLQREPSHGAMERPHDRKVQLGQEQDHGLRGRAYRDTARKQPPAHLHGPHRLHLSPSVEEPW